MCVFHGLMTLGRSHVNLTVNILSLAATLAVAASLVEEYTLTGAAMALLAGSAVGTVVQIIWFILVLKRHA
jgi:O-antigen/teichoic acid export membrane protein